MATRLNGENSTDNELEINDRENRMDNQKTRATLDTRHRNTTAVSSQVNVWSVIVKGKRIIAIREVNRVMVIMVFHAKFNYIF